jgi:hypothetical protein
VQSFCLPCLPCLPPVNAKELVNKVAVTANKNILFILDELKFRLIKKRADILAGSVRRFPGG